MSDKKDKEEMVMKGFLMQILENQRILLKDLTYRSDTHSDSRNADIGNALSATEAVLKSMEEVFSD